MPTRRTFLQSAAFLPLGAVLPLAEGSRALPRMPMQTGRDYFEEMGLGYFINAAAPYSSLGGSQMWPEVIEAMDYAMIRRARMKELHDAVGVRIAAMAGSDAAMVTAGATSAMILGTAACLTGTNQDFIHRLPDTAGMKGEVIIQRGHRYSYEHAIRNCGARLVEVVTVEDLDRAISENTAMMMFNFSQEGQGDIKAEEWVALATAYDIPTFCDGATMIPPIENLYAIVDYGFDLVCFSGGKGLRGPYSAGLLLGRPHLIEAARLNGAPNDDTIGRGMKVSKEELLGAMVALETSIAFDYVSYIRTRKEWVQRIAVELEGAPGVETELYYPKGDNHQPQLRITWDTSRIRLTPAEAKRRLREGTPSVEVHALSLTDGNLEVTAWMLEPGEAEVVGQRIREVLMGARAGVPPRVGSSSLSLSR